MFAIAYHWRFLYHYKTELLHGLLVGFRIDICMYICISERDDVVVKLFDSDIWEIN